MTNRNAGDGFERSVGVTDPALGSKRACTVCARWRFSDQAYDFDAIGHGAMLSALHPPSNAPSDPQLELSSSDSSTRTRTRVMPFDVAPPTLSLKNLACESHRESRVQTYRHHRYETTPLVIHQRRRSKPHGTKPRPRPEPHYFGPDANASATRTRLEDKPRQFLR